MGQCQSDNNSLADGITSLPPTLSMPSSRSLEAEYSPPKLLTPRQRKAIVQQEVIATLSPPQSPAAMVATRSKEKIKEAEVDQTRSIGMTIEVSSSIAVVDIKPKMTTPLRAAEPEKYDPTPHVSSSPPVPFHKQLATPRFNIATDDKTEVAVIAVKKEDINSNRTAATTKKLQARYEGILRMIFLCYMAAIAFSSIICRNLFHHHTNAHGVAVPDTDVLPVATLDTSTETRKGQLEFLQAIGDFKLQEDLMPLLPLNAVKEMLSDNKHILDTIEQELSEIVHDAVLI
jgi:hypothetical protein